MGRGDRDRDRDRERGHGKEGVVAGGVRPTVLVVFIGGVTYAEISALRFLGNQGGLNCNFVVVTTKLVNGHTLIASLLQGRGQGDGTSAA